MFQFGDLFKGGFSFMNQQPALEDKLSNQNLPLEDFLKDDEAVSTIKFMGKNTKKYLNSEKIKQLIKLITEEPKIDDQLHGHKFPYVAFQILKSDCPFIAKRFVLNEQEYHEEYPDSPEDEIDELGLDLDIENENENKEIEFDFKKNKIEFEKIYQQIEENFRNIRKSISEDKEEKRSKDDSERDVYKTDNNNYEEEYEEYEDIKEDNVIDDINTDDNTNEKNSEDIEEEKEKEEELKDNELNDIEDDNINKKDNIGNENNEEKNCAKTKENKEEEKQEGNNEVDIEKDNIEENKEANIEKLDNKKDEEKEEKNKAETKKINNEETLDKNDVKIEENNNEENKEKNDVETVKNKKEENIEKEVTKENNNDGEEIKDKNETKEINNNNILNEENQESIDNKEKKDDANKENKDSIENKKDNVEDNKENNDIKNYRANLMKTIKGVMNREQIIIKVKEIMSYNDEEMNSLSYILALKYDKRTFFQYYFSLLKTNHIIFFTFNKNKNDYNSKIIKIDLFFVEFIVELFVNALFFSDDTMHKIYEDEGDFNFLYQLPQIIFSTLISKVFNLLFNNFALSEANILDFKNNKSIKHLSKRAKKLFFWLKVKFIIYFIISSILVLFFWYYLAMFCAIYRNTQSHLIKDTLLSFVLSLLYPFVIYLLPGIFRIRSLSDKDSKKKYIYNFSIILQKILLFNKIF